MIEVDEVADEEVAFGVLLLDKLGAISVGNVGERN